MPPGCDSFFHQCLSPDGRTIAFCGNYSTLDRKFDSDKDRRRYFKAHPELELEHGLFLVDLKTQAVQQVLKETIANLPSWSPDSKYLACGVGQYLRDYPLVIVERESGKVHRVAAKGTAAGWSPHADKLAIVTDIVTGGSWLAGYRWMALLAYWTWRGLSRTARRRSLVFPTRPSTCRRKNRTHGQ